MEPFALVVVGGGIAASSCIEEVCKLDSNCNILVISSSPVLKTAYEKTRITRRTVSFGIEEKTQSALSSQVHFIQGTVDKIDFIQKKLILQEGNTYLYHKLCICSGAYPKSLAPGNPRVLTLRDTTSLQRLKASLQTCRRLVLVGNGGIALELVYELQGCEIFWVIRDSTLGSAFFDEEASHYLWDIFEESKYNAVSSDSKNASETVEPVKLDSSQPGWALGPEWHREKNEQSGEWLKGRLAKKSVHVLLNCEVMSICTKETASTQCPKENDRMEEWPVYVKLQDNSTIGCDLVICAIGVLPNIHFVRNSALQLSSEGILVNERMETNLEDIYAAGDCCWIKEHATAELWFQMRLWSQAYYMGKVAAHSILQSELISDMTFYFELFTHSTEFFGQKVVLLGLYNAQNLRDHFQVIGYQSPKSLLVSERKMIRVVLQDGKMKGALLIGETELEETYENLILSGLSVEHFQEALVSPELGIDDYFD